MHLQGFDGAVGQHVLTVTATDADADANGNVTYTLSGVGAELFSIGATTGEVTVGSHGVDYERVLDTPYSLTVSAMDGGLDPIMLCYLLSIHTSHLSQAQVYHLA